MQARTPIDPYAAGSATIPGAAARAAAPDGAAALPPRVSWGAIIAGAVVAVAIGLMLNILGVAVGATAVDAVEGGTPSASTFGIGAGLWLLVANLIGFVLSAVLLGNLASGAASTVAGAASGLLGGAAQTASSAVSAVADQANPRAILERARAGLSGPSEPARMTTEQRASEITSILGGRLSGSALTDAERQRLTALVAAEAGIPEAEAAQRVRSYEAEAQRLAREAEARAREAANAAATGAATAALAVFAALLLGAIAAIVGARAGVRDLPVVARLPRQRVA